MSVPSPTGPADTPLSASLRDEIERWFSQRGVPQLIDDYTTERRIDARAGPFVLTWLVGGSILWWGTRPDWSPLLNFAGAFATLLTMGLGVAAFRRLRGHVMWWTDQRLEVIDAFSLGPLVAVPSMIIEGSWLVGLVNGRDALLGIGSIYAVIGLGLGTIAWWAIGRLRDELTRIAELLAKTLPTLLILVLFLLFAAELWEAAHLLSAGELAAVVILLLAVAALLILTAFRSEIPAMENADWQEMQSLAAGTPAGALANAIPYGAPPPLRPLQRLNLALLVLGGQLIQSVFVTLVVTGFLVAFGSLALPATLQERWIGETVTALVHFDLLGESRVLSRELVTVATLLGSVVGLYFTGLAITDSRTGSPTSSACYTRYANSSPPGLSTRRRPVPSRQKSAWMVGSEEESVHVMRLGPWSKLPGPTRYRHTGLAFGAGSPRTTRERAPGARAGCRSIARWG